ncbi:MAG: aminoacyl-tRNA hydrolase [Cyanobacteriota bacterium]|nr:aminoacyl-tRNA hydrolase [Cyanobacteriota bacterium]
MSGIHLIVGLGNPGRQYQNTRHNCGFMVLEYLADRWGIPLRLEKRFRGRWGEGVALQAKQRLLLPETYMNLSGESVRTVVDWYKISADQVLVIYDDMDLPLGRIRLRANGSSGGHNGIKSLIQHLGTQEFPRLRIGVGQPKGEKDVVGHVLGGFSEKEQPCWSQVLRVAAEAVETLIQQDLSTAMNRFNALDICPTPSSSA